MGLVLLTRKQYNHHLVISTVSIIILLLFRSLHLEVVGSNSQLHISRSRPREKVPKTTRKKPSCDYIHPEKQLIWLELIIWCPVSNWPANRYPLHYIAIISFFDSFTHTVLFLQFHNCHSTLPLKKVVNTSFPKKIQLRLFFMYVCVFRFLSYQLANVELNQWM